MFPDYRYLLITGRLGTGKSTLANNLKGRIELLSDKPRQVSIFHLADRIREELLILNPWIKCLDGGFCKLVDLVTNLGWTEAKKEPEVRTWLQSYGENQRLWTKPSRWFSQVPSPALDKIVIIPDIRLEVEIKYICSLPNSGEQVIILFLNGNDNQTGSHSTEELTPARISNILAFKKKLIVLPETHSAVSTANLAWKAILEG